MSTAWEVFKKQGFERATMSEISARVGGSKATLYGYFKSKEELFAAALENEMEKRAATAFQHLQSAGDLGARLLKFARAYLEVRLSPDMIALDRALICEAERTGLGAMLLSRFVTPHWRRLAEHLDGEMREGAIRRSDPYCAAIHFRGLIENDVLERRLHGDATITAEEVEAAVSSGVDAFLRAYSTPPLRDS